MKFKNSISLLSLCLFAFFTTAFAPPQETKTKSIDRPETVDPSFVEFLSLFEKVEMPFEIGLDDFEKYQNQKISKKVSKKKGDDNTRNQTNLMYQYVQDEMFMSRMGPPQIMPIARFYPNEKTIAVIYMPYRSFGRSDDLVFKLLLFDLNGKNISNQEDNDFLFRPSFVLGSTSAYRPTQTFCIYPNGLIKQETYKVIWKNDIEKTGVENNEITDYVLEKTTDYKIKADGNILLEKEANASDRAMVE